MNKFVIAVPSKGRAGASQTLAYLERVTGGIPVYVYADEGEAAAYREFYTGFTVVPHDKKTIGAIRRLIQDEQAAADNTVFMLDDDILGFYNGNGEGSVSWGAVLDGVLGMLAKDYECIGLRLESQRGGRTYEVFYGVALVLAPSLWAKGVRFTEEDISEDTDFSIQIGLQGGTVQAGRLPFFAKHLHKDVNSDFDDEWYRKSNVSLYKKYGRVIKLALSVDVLAASIDESRYTEFLERGPVYSKVANNFLVSLYKYNFIDKDFILDALAACRCKRGQDGDFCEDYDYNGYDGSRGDEEALKHGHEREACPQTEEI